MRPEIVSSPHFWPRVQQYFHNHPSLTFQEARNIVHNIMSMELDEHGITFPPDQPSPVMGISANPWITEPTITMAQSPNEVTNDIIDDVELEPITESSLGHAVPSSNFDLGNNPTMQTLNQIILDDIQQMTSSLRTKKVIEDVNTSMDKKLPIQHLYRYKSLVLRKQDSIAYEKANTIKEKPFEFVTNNGMIGIEVEVENINNSVPLVAYWGSHADGSLRNNGVEFVSVPLQVKQIQLACEHLFHTLKATNKYDFSNRTSIHIHLNCRDMTQDEIYTMVLLYAIFEKYFYSFAGTKRLNSIFCVPLFRSNILKCAENVIYKFAPSWHKYCGINLLPLVDNNGTQGYGTIEFRHLYGTDNLQELYEWIDTILCLRNAALKTVKLEELMQDIREMNTSSSYCSLFTKVFPNKKLPTNGKEFEECVSNIKRELYKLDFLKSLSKVDRSPYWLTVEKLGARG